VVLREGNCGQTWVGLRLSVRRSGHSQFAYSKMLKCVFSAAMPPDVRKVCGPSGSVDSLSWGLCPRHCAAQCKVKEFIKDARQNGKVVAGGRVLARDGYFVRPTIVRDVSDTARLVREEQFGPALPVLRYSDIDDVIDRVNDTDFGLGASVWSSDLGRAFEVA